MPSDKCCMVCLESLVQDGKELLLNVSCTALHKQTHHALLNTQQAAIAMLADDS